MSGFIDSLGNLGVAPSIERLVRQGQAFGGTSGKLTLAAAGDAGVALWNPATSNRQVFLYRGPRKTPGFSDGDTSGLATLDTHVLYMV